MLSRHDIYADLRFSENKLVNLYFFVFKPNLMNIQMADAFKE